MGWAEEHVPSTSVVEREQQRVIQAGMRLAEAVRGYKDNEVSFTVMLTREREFTRLLNQVTS